MTRKRIIRLLVFSLIVFGIVAYLKQIQEKKVQGEEEKVLPAQIETVREKIKGFPEELKKFVPNLPNLPDSEEKKATVQKEVEKRVEEIVKEIKSLPEEQLKEVKKEVFCTQICQQTCQDVCE